MPGDLPVGRFVVLDRGRNAACFAQAVNLDHIGRDTGLHRLPDIRCDQDTCKPKAGERDKTPVSRLHARGADTLVPELAGALIGSLGFGRLPISLDGSLEEHGRLLLVAKVGVGAAAGPVAVARSEEHTSELQSLMRTSYAVFCLTK